MVGLARHFLAGNNGRRPNLIGVLPLARRRSPPFSCQAPTMAISGAHLLTGAHVISFCQHL